MTKDVLITIVIAKAGQVGRISQRRSRQPQCLKQIGAKMRSNPGASSITDDKNMATLQMFVSTA